jgi:hypothetical protein
MLPDSLIRTKTIRGPGWRRLAVFMVGLWAFAILHAGPALVHSSKTGVPMDQKTAEKLSRESWFDFELTGVGVRFKGDWAAFYAAKRAEEERLAHEWETDKEELMHSRSPVLSAEDARSLRVVQLEFDSVASLQTGEILSEAKRILLALQKGDVEALVEGSVKYDRKSKDWKTYTLDDFRKHKAEWTKAAKGIKADKLDSEESIYFESPDPYRGMVARVHIPFGPRVPRKAGSMSRPEYHEIELWWSGQVMPEANGPLLAAPKSTVPVKGGWHFYNLNLPHSDPGTQHLQ